MTVLPRATQARIDRSALLHNLQRVRTLAPGRRVLAMVKADAYGHGLTEVAKALTGQADGLGVACIPEALALRATGLTGRIVVMQGFKDRDELAAARARSIDVVIHDPEQLACLESAGYAGGTALTVWVKIDTGMHRIGFLPEEVPEVCARLRRSQGVHPELHFLSHFACADDPASTLTDRQITRFKQATQDVPGPRSLSNSAGILTLPEAHFDWVRPGIMLYGGSPFAHLTAASFGLRPVMTLEAPLIAIHRRSAGDTIGYGSTYRCPQETRIGIVAIGYGDGYPRHAPNGTPAALGGQTVPVVGRVSMDMLAIDLQERAARVGDLVTLWGEHPPADEVAAQAQTISYELFCAAGSKAQRLYV